MDWLTYHNERRITYKGLIDSFQQVHTVSNDSPHISILLSATCMQRNVLVGI